MTNNPCHALALLFVKEMGPTKDGSDKIRRIKLIRTTIQWLTGKREGLLNIKNAIEWADSAPPVPWLDWIITAISKEIEGT